MTKEEAFLYLDKYYEYNGVYYAPYSISRIKDTMDYYIINEELKYENNLYKISSENNFFTKYIGNAKEITREEYNFNANRIIKASDGIVEYINTNPIYQTLLSHCKLVDNRFSHNPKLFIRRLKLNKNLGILSCEKYLGSISFDPKTNMIYSASIHELVLDKIDQKADGEYNVPYHSYEISKGFHNYIGAKPVIEYQVTCGLDVKQSNSLLTNRLTSFESPFSYIPEDIFISVRDSILQYQSTI